MRSKGFTLIEIMVVMIIVMILAGIGFVGYTKYVESAKVSKLMTDLREYGVASLSFYKDTGILVGSDASVMFPDALANVQAIRDEDVRSVWRGPYVKNVANCPYTKCKYSVDYVTGQATQQGEVFQYFIVAENVPIKAALELSRSLNGDRRTSECVIANVGQVRVGAQKPCVVYLERTTGGAGEVTKVYYTYVVGSY